MKIHLHKLAELACVLLCVLCAPQLAAAATDGWQTTTPAQAGMRADVADQLDAAVRKGELKNLHAVVVVRGGKLVFERYYEGKDERWTVPLGVVKFGPDVKHDLRSTSKSVTGLLYGIALGEGKVAAPDQPLLAQFPAYQDLNKDARRRKIKIEHVLSMTSGLEWHEDLPYTDPRNSEVAMYRAPNAARYVLEQAMAAEPGTRWQYCGGATAILGQLIAQGTGMPLFDYARAKLFEPLGITNAEWVGGSNGVVAAASGVRLRPRDLAKIGQLVLNNGRWGDQQVVPAGWLQESLKPHGHPPPMSDIGEFGYGYHWGLVRVKGSNQQWIFAPGNGGQRLFIVPEQQLVVAILAGNYNAEDQDEIPDTVIGKFVMPALAEHSAVGK
jgi:CubicO group peptidase (beta-lactamase class C family)